VELNDPKIADVGDVDSDNVGGVGDSEGAWPWYRVGGGRAETGREVATNCVRFGCGSSMWGGKGSTLH
jgi:hypothetical protein